MSSTMLEPVPADAVAIFETSRGVHYLLSPHKRPATVTGETACCRKGFGQVTATTKGPQSQLCDFVCSFPPDDVNTVFSYFLNLKPRLQPTGRKRKK